MTDTGQLGGRLPLRAQGVLTDEQSHLYQRMRTNEVPWTSHNFEGMTDDERLIGPFNPILYSPEAAGGFPDFEDVEGRASTLEQRSLHLCKKELEMKQILFPGNAKFWYETLRSFDHIDYGGADFAEVLTISASPRAVTTAGTTSMWPPRTGLRPRPRCGPATGLARRMGCCGRPTTTGRPTSSCTATRTTLVTITPTTVRSPASVRRRSFSPRRWSRCRSLTRAPRCPATSTASMTPVSRATVIFHTGFDGTTISAQVTKEEGSDAS